MKDIIAIDIETDTGPCHEPQLPCCHDRGLDPAGTTITAIAISDVFGEQVLLADELGGEAAMLIELERLLSTKTGTLVTWNGAVFDLPFIADRARLLGVNLSLHLCPGPELEVKYAPIPGHQGGYHAVWGGLQHHDVQYAFKTYAEINDLRWSLKPVAGHLGLAPVEVDRTRMHELSKAELVDYVASDAKITRLLAERL
jgi:hypothetical protein